MWYDEQELRDVIKEDREGFYEWYQAVESQIKSYDQTDTQTMSKRSRRKRRAPKHTSR